MAAQKARSRTPAKRSARGARPRADGATQAASTPRRSGQGAGSAYAEMMRRQAQSPRVVPAADRDPEARPQAPGRGR